MSFPLVFSKILIRSIALRWSDFYHFQIYHKTFKSLTPFVTVRQSWKMSNDWTEVGLRLCSDEKPFWSLTFRQGRFAGPGLTPWFRGCMACMLINAFAKLLQLWMMLEIWIQGFKDNLQKCLCLCKQDHLGIGVAPMFDHSFWIDRSYRSLDHWVQ